MKHCNSIGVLSGGDISECVEMQDRFSEWLDEPFDGMPGRPRTYQFSSQFDFAWERRAHNRYWVLARSLLET